MLAKKIGYSWALRLGAICTLLFTVGVLIVDNFILLILLQIIFSLGFAFSEPAVGALAMKNLRLEGYSNSFAKLEGKGISLYYFMNAIGIVLIGYLYNVSPYAAMSTTCVTSAIYIVLAFLFKDESKS